MLNELLNNLDLIGIAVAIILLIGLVIYKISQKNASEELIEDELDTQTDKEQITILEEDEYDATQANLQEVETAKEEAHEKETNLVETEPEDMGAEEGDFGVIEEEEVQEPQELQKKAFQKRDVPPHGKITKENFKEFAGKRILLAEDNIINQKVILGLLADSGIEVVVANDGAEALNILEKDTNFIVILMDAHMPNIDGFEATRRIRANKDYDHIVVTALSGDTAADDIRKMTEAGMSEHLEKPLKMDALYDVLYAYSGNTQEEQPESETDTISIVSTKELDGEKGLEVCGGDDEFYREILNEFLTTYSDSDEKILDMVHNDQLQQADKLLLDIIGVSANIGAMKLHNVATHIKDSLSDSVEKSYLTLIQQYQHHLKILINDIQEYLK